MSKKAPDKLLIFSILFAALIVAGTIVFVSLQQRQQGAQSSSAAGTRATASMAPYNEQIIIQESLRSCQKGDTCIVVDTTCSFCCKYVAINAKHEKLFNELFDNSCQGFSGATCQCFDLASYPACVNGKCQLVKWDEEKKKP